MCNQLYLMFKRLGHKMLFYSSLLMLKTLFINLYSVITYINTLASLIVSSCWRTTMIKCKILGPDDLYNGSSTLNVFLNLKIWTRWLNNRSFEFTLYWFLMHNLWLCDFHNGSYSFELTLYWFFNGKFWGQVTYNRSSILNALLIWNFGSGVSIIVVLNSLYCLYIDF